MVWKSRWGLGASGNTVALQASVRGSIPLGSTMKTPLESITNARKIVGECKGLMNEFDAAMRSTLYSSKTHNDEINAARERIKACWDEMKNSELPPRKERAIRENRPK